MSAKKRKNKSTDTIAVGTRPVPTGRLFTIRACFIVALLISGYLAFLSFSGGRAVGCGPESGCDKILNSRWAYWFGVPVSLLALAVDSLVLFATFRLGDGKPASEQRTAWRLLIPGSVMVLGAAIWFVMVQAFIEKTLCPYCMAAHGAGMVGSLLLLFSAPIRPAPDKAREVERAVFISPGGFRKATGVAILGVAALIAGQSFHKPKSFVVQNLARSLAQVTNAAPTNASPPDTTPPASAGAPGTSAPNPPEAPQAGRPFPLYNGRFMLDVTDVPTIGAPTNAQVMVALHDYTCSHCRVMHPVLTEAQRTFRQQLVIVTLPMPLDPGCNPTVTRQNPKHTNACAYARLSLAVWRADRTKHHDFDDFLFAGRTAPPIELAAQTAAQMVGQPALEKALNDPWVDQQLRFSVGLYETALRSGQGSMPQFMIGQNVAVGTLPMPDLMGLLARNLGLIPQGAPQ